MRQAGFTLSELLLVLAVLGVMALLYTINVDMHSAHPDAAPAEFVCFGECDPEPQACRAEWVPKQARSALCVPEEP